MKLKWEKKRQFEGLTTFEGLIQANLYRHTEFKDD